MTHIGLLPNNLENDLAGFVRACASKHLMGGDYVFERKDASHRYGQFLLFMHSRELR
jgi:hypothetical protein